MMSHNDKIDKMAEKRNTMVNTDALGSMCFQHSTDIVEVPTAQLMATNWSVAHQIRSLSGHIKPNHFHHMVCSLLGGFLLVHKS